MPDFGRWNANGGDPSLSDINRSDQFLDALASGGPVYAADQGEAAAEQQGCRPAMAQQRAGAAAAPALAGAAHDGRCAPGRD